MYICTYMVCFSLSLSFFFFFFEKETYTDKGEGNGLFFSLLKESAKYFFG